MSTQKTGKLIRSSTKLQRAPLKPATTRFESSALTAEAFVRTNLTTAAVLLHVHGQLMATELLLPLRSSAMTSTPHNWSFQNDYNNYFLHTAIAAIAGPVAICIAEAADSHQIRCETVMEDAVQRIQSTTLSACDASSLARTPQTSLYGRGIQQEAVYGHSYPAHDSNPYGKPRHVDNSRRQVCADDAATTPAAAKPETSLCRRRQLRQNSRNHERD